MTRQTGNSPFLSFRLPQRELDRLTRVAKEKGYTRSEFARRILRQALMFADDFEPKAVKRRPRPRPGRLEVEDVAVA